MKLIKILLFQNYLILVYLLIVDGKSQYCNITCDGKKHTMCEYPAGGPHQCSRLKRGLSHNLKMVLVDLHNDLREQVAMGKGDAEEPEAANMMQLRWSEEAEKIAQRWADQCNQGDSEDGCRTLANKEPGGQNILDTETHKTFDMYFFEKNTVMDWFYTGRNFNKHFLSKYKYDPNSAAYTQIVWAASYDMGCGLSYGYLNGTMMWRLVCNYYPAGNVEGQPVYVKGTPCSRCPSGPCVADSKWPTLCDHPRSKVYNRNVGVPTGLGGAPRTVAFVTALSMLWRRWPIE